MFAGRKNGLPRWVTALAAALGCAALAVQWGRNMAARCGALRAWRRVLTRMEAGMSLYADLPSLLFFAAEGEENGEVAQELSVSKPYAYKLIKKLNDELKQKGFITIAGRVNRQYFEERLYGAGKGES